MFENHSNYSSLTSVVIPAHNAERFIERTLQSALRQTWNNLEILVVDDGSTDKTKSIVEAVALTDQRIRIFSLPNGGVASARNIGLAHARGEFVAFLDADDLWHPSKIEMQVAALKSASNAAASYVMFRGIDRFDRVTGNQNAVGISGYTLAHHLYSKPVGNGSSLLVRREVAIEVGGYDPSWAARGIGGCEDYDFELKIIARYPVVFVRKYLLGYRSYPGNMSSNYTRMALGLIATVDQHLRCNNGLPAWLVRKVTAKTMEFAIAYFFSGRHFTRLFACLFRLFLADPIAGATSVLTISKRVYAYVFDVKPTKSTNGQPRFSDMSPDEGVVAYKSTRQEQKTWKRIAELDLALASQKQIRP